MPNRLFLCVPLFVSLALASGNALAICQPIAHYIYVGTGAKCDTASIQTAITNAACPATTVVISTQNGETYTGQHIAIAGKSLTITGTTGVCDSPPVVCDPDIGCGGGGPPARIKIGGNGTDPVFSISGNSHVVLANLDISGGKGAQNSTIGGGGVGFNSSGGALTLNNLRVHDNVSGYGGGVGIYGDGMLTISGSLIDLNHASAGGGISAFSSYIGHIELIVADNAAIPTEVASNRADNDGGGIYAGGNVHLQAVASAPNRITIHDNHADNATHTGGNGGGIEFTGTAFADIALPGGSIYSNSAAFGAGIFVGASSDGDSVVRLFSTDAAHPTMLFGNVATYSGGGLMVGATGGSTHATACLFDTAIGSNTASQNGTAINVADAGRLFVNPQNNPECDYAAVAALGAVHCNSSSLNCNRIVVNPSTSSSPNETPGVIDFTGAAQISARRVHIETNTASYVIRGQYATAANVAFSECVIDYNTVSNELVNVQGAPISFDGCTFAGDSIGAANVFVWDTGFSLTRSIVAESTQVLQPARGGATVNYAIFNNPKLPTNSSVLYVDPRFVDAANGDFHLQATSPAIDFAPTGDESGNTDFDNRPREADLPEIANQYGARDLGAFEYPLADEIFRNGFELPL